MLIIAWEVTSACNLKCEYCRASATRSPDEDELTSEEALRFIDSVSPLNPMIILSGGEPLLRPDIFELARHASAQGIRVALATNGTLLSPEMADKIRESGIKRVSISLDGASPEIHDASRGEGCFQKVLRGIESLRRKLPFQINMTITRSNVAEVENMMDLAQDLGAVALHLFFLVPTGRGREDELVSPQEQDELLRQVARECTRRPMEIKVTCAPQFTRIMREELTKEEREKMMGSACLAGTGFVFVSRRGEVCPCGYLPVVAGNIRQESFVDIWENSPVFMALRERKLEGRCGECPYRLVCGGCRARAYAITGDYLESDPLCTYQVGELEARLE
jgi:radical SAM protein with 4Fe4S-binding SPASM domain